MEQTENPLLSLSSEKQQQIVDLVENGDIADIAEKGGMTRRQVLQVAVALGAGATAGGYSVDQIIGEARAAADTADSDGNVGLPGDRVDLFAEGADISGTATANQVGEQSDRFTGYADNLDATTASVGGRASKTVTVPGDYATLQDAVDDNLYQFPASDAEVVVNIESGYAIQTGTSQADPAGQAGTEPVSLWLENADASHIRITSDDATVPVESGFDGSVIRQVNSRGVTLDCKIDMSNTGTGIAGYSAEIGSVGRVRGENGAGVINAPDRGVYARQNSLMYAAFGADFSGAGNRCADANHGSFAYLRGGNYDDSGDLGIRNHGAFVDAMEATARNATNDGVYVFDAGVLSAQLMDASNCGGRGFRNNEAYLSAGDVTATGCDVGLRADGGHTDANGSDFSSYGTYGARVVGGFANLTDTTYNTSGSSSDIDILQGAIVSAHFTGAGSNISKNTLVSEGIRFG